MNAIDCRLSKTFYFCIKINWLNLPEIVLFKNKN